MITVEVLSAASAVVQTCPDLTIRYPFLFVSHFQNGLISDVILVHPAMHGQGLSLGDGQLLNGFRHLRLHFDELIALTVPGQLPVFRIQVPFLTFCTMTIQ